MEPESGRNEGVVSLFDDELRWWSEVYREELPQGFFSFEMRRRRELVVDILAGHIARMRRPAVLECGCGPGDILAHLTRLPCRLHGLDINPRYLELAAQRAPGVQLREGDLEQLPYADATFDIVYAVGVLMYLQNDRQALAEIARVLRPGGIALISVPNHFTLSCLLDPYYLCRPFLGREREKGEVKVRRYRLGPMRQLLAARGLRPIDCRAVSFGPWRFWRREILPLAAAVRLSEGLRRASARLPALVEVSSHWICVLRKDDPAGNRRGAP